MSDELSPAEVRLTDGLAPDAGCMQATPHGELLAQLMDPNVPKSEREHAATDELERLYAEAATFQMSYRAKCDETIKAQVVEIERLRVELAEAVTALPQAVRAERERCCSVVRALYDAWIQEYGCKLPYDAGRLTGLEDAEQAISGA